MSVMKNLFEQFEKAGIEYVHFKSNTHLDDSFLGKGDFDVLVRSNHLVLAEEIILRNNGKRYNSFYYGRYPGVDNWLLFDNNTGDIKHLHLHCQLCTGKSQIKDYVIPWADYILKNKIYDEEWNIYITDPNVEILLLLLRTIVKSKNKDYVKACLGSYNPHKDLHEEWTDLIPRIDYSQVDFHIEQFFNNEETKIIKELVRLPKLNSKGYLKLNKIVRRYLKNNRRMSGLKAGCLSLYQKFLIKWAYLKKRRDIGWRPIKKTCISGGAIIAFVGVDGSGKSTTVGEIEKWLSHKIECKRYYMGEGDGNISKTAFLLKRILNRKRISRSVNGETTLSADDVVKKSPVRKKNFKNRVGSFLRGWMICNIQRNNYKKIVRMNKYRLEGGVCLLDRYPQIECPDKNDGPKIDSIFALYPNSYMKRFFKKREDKFLNIVKEIKPDLIFRLNISAEESMKRKPEQKKIQEFQQKISDLSSIHFQGAKIINIDATQTYDTELLEIKTLIWEYL